VPQLGPLFSGGPMAALLPGGLSYRRRVHKRHPYKPFRLDRAASNYQADRGLVYPASHHFRRSGTSSWLVFGAGMAPGLAQERDDWAVEAAKDWRR